MDVEIRRLLAIVPGRLIGRTTLLSEVVWDIPRF